MLYRLLSQTNRSLYSSTVISLIGEGALVQPIRALGVPVYSLGMRDGRPSLASAIRLVRLLRRLRPDIVQTWMYHADLLGLLAAGLARRPTVVWNIRASNVDMSHYGRLSRWTRWLCANLSGRPKAVIVNSRAGLLYHSEIGYHPREWVLIQNGIDTTEFKPDREARASLRAELSLAPDTPLIGLVARWDPMKDHHTFITAASILLGHVPEVRFVLAGRGIEATNEALRNLVGAQGLASNTHLLGERHDLPRLTAALDIGTSSSSSSEGFPNVVGEAMSCGVPCVVTAVGDSADIVGDTGYVVPPRNPDALAAAWRTLLELGPEGRAELGMQARRRIEELFSLGEAVRKYEDLYRRLAI